MRGRSCAFGASLVALASLVLGLGLLPGCGDDPPASPAGTGGTGRAGNGGVDGPATFAVLDLAMDEVPWNAKAAEVGNVQIVVDTPSATLVFGSLGMQVFTAGVVATSDANAKDFRSAAVIAGPASNRVLVALADGTVSEVESLRFLGPASDRLGLGGKDVRWIANANGRAVFGLPTGVAIAEGGTTGFFDMPALASPCASGSRVAGLAEDAQNVRVFDASAGTLVGYPVPTATAVAFDAHDPPRLVVAAGQTLYREDERGGLAIFWDAPAPITALASADGRVWAIVGEELARVDDASVALTKGSKLTAASRLQASGLGAWITGGALRRLSLHAETPDEDLWNKSIQPIFARSCTPCHLPNGSSGTNLSSYGLWDDKRETIAFKVFGDATTPGTMPPAGYPLSATDKTAIGVFTASSVGGAAGGGGSAAGAGGTAGAGP